VKKLIIAVSLCVASSVSMAAVIDVCTGTAGNAVNPIPTDTTGASFVKTGFTAKCSANTQVKFDQTAAVAAVGSASTKGNQVFGGHTNGGSVALDTTVTCATSGCTATNAGTALTNALAAGSS
jgi:hypothetical protein